MVDANSAGDYYYSSTSDSIKNPQYIIYIYILEAIS